MDRVCISVAAPAMRDEFGFTATEMGLVFSIFSLAYFLFLTPWGMLADRFGARGIVTLAIFWWSAFTALTGAAWSLVSLLAIRFLFGAVEAALSPSIASAYKRWIPVSERATAFGAFLSGGRIGGAATPPIAAFLVIQYGWRTMFQTFAIVGVVWVGLWYSWFRNYPKEHAWVNAEELKLIEGEEQVEPDRPACRRQGTRLVPASYFPPSPPAAGRGVRLHLHVAVLHHVVPNISHREPGHELDAGSRICRTSLCVRRGGELDRGAAVRRP